MEKGEFIVEEEQLSVQAGVPRREQCLVCAKPIFLAERLKVAEKFYHRRCLKCARCQTQLTLGSFYETEVDGQFCCETCPDEEVRIGSEEEDEDEVDEVIRDRELAEQQRKLAEEEKRISSLISNRLAMFERKPDQGVGGGGEGPVKPSWRNSSLSDEQKSRSMKNFLKSSTEDEIDDLKAPPLPSQGPPEVKRMEPEVITTTPVIANEVILREKEEVVHEEKRQEELRESQSVSNIREMFEKKGVKRPGSGDKVVVDSGPVRKSSPEVERKEVPVPVVEEKEEVPPPIFSHNEDALSVPTKDGEKIGNPEENIPPPLSKEEEEQDPLPVTPVTTSIDEISPPTLIGKDDNSSQSVDPAHSHDERSEEPNEAQLTTIADREEEKLLDEAVPQQETESEQNIESSATKESDQIKEPSLELRRPDGGDLEHVEDDQQKIAVPLAEEEQEVVDESGTSGDQHNNCNEIAPETVPSEEQQEVESSDNIKYPLDLNPFGSEDEEDQGASTAAGVANKSVSSAKGYNPNLNPFGDDDEDGEEEKIKVVYRQPEPKRISTNPFGSEEDEEEETKKVTPVPTPRRTIMSQRPEPSPRFQLRVPTTDYYGSASSLSRSSDFNFRGSTNSLSSTCSSANTSGTYQRTLKKRRAPLPPSMMMREAASAEYLDVVPGRKSSNGSMVSDKSGQKSTSTSPRISRKKRPAPKPPGPGAEAKPEDDESIKSPPSFGSESLEMAHSTPMKVNQSAAADKTKYFTADGEKMSEIMENPEKSLISAEKSSRRMIPLDDQLLEDRSEISMPPEPEESVYYRRVIVPLADEDHHPGELGFSDDVKRSEDIRSSRQWEKVKQNKESDNRNRQSLVSNSSDGNGEFDRFYNKSQHGKWKRRKGPAPSLPVPPKRVLQMLPLQDIKHELEVIEVQQQGLEKQGVQLEKMIREKTEGPDAVSNTSQAEDSLNSSTLSASNRNTKEVEDLIMQLFDLVVEKNELFRRQAELMYLRRQQRLEQEQADLEYEIRVLMAQPECNKTDSDKAKEEAMIARMVEVVKQRNEVVDSLEMDRLREAQEDLGIKQEIEKHTAKWDEEFSLKNQKPVKLSKKEKKTLKEEKKKLKNKKLDVDKDYDETETQSGEKSLSSSGGTLEKLKKKKKKFLIL